MARYQRSVEVIVGRLYSVYAKQDLRSSWMPNSLKILPAGQMPVKPDAGTGLSRYHQFDCAR